MENNEKNKITKLDIDLLWNKLKEDPELSPILDKLTKAGESIHIKSSGDSTITNAKYECGYCSACFPCFPSSVGLALTTLAASSV